MTNRDTPAGTPPPGVTSNFDHPANSLYPEIAATVILAIVLTTFATATRLIAKRAVSKFHIEDWYPGLTLDTDLSIVTWLLLLGYCGAFMLQAMIGIGRHIWDVRLIDVPEIRQISWALELLYCVAIWLAKAVLLLQLQRTFAPSKSGAVYIVCQLLLWINLVFYLISFFGMLVQCVPQTRIWDPLVTTGHCIDMCVLLVTTGAINVISDLSMFVMPMYIVWNLHLDMRRKIGISAVFATGILAVVSSVFRLISALPPLEFKDFTYFVAPVWLWSIAEITSVILCTCFPYMPRFFKIITGKHGRQAHSSQDSSEGKPSFREAGSENTYTSRVMSSKHCEDCSLGLPCMIHDRDSQLFIGRDLDEERMYIVKKISYDVVKHKPVSFDIVRHKSERVKIREIERKKDDPDEISSTSGSSSVS